MKRKLIFVAVMAVIASCAKTSEIEESIITKSQVFTASIECTGTRTFLDSNMKLLWTADDRISVFTTTYNQQYKFDGETGDNSGDFSEVKNGFHSGNAISTNYAVYPYCAETKISNGEVITLILPSVQKYAEGTFGLGANTMVAVTESASSTFLPFKNVCGYLVVKVYGEGTVKSVSLRGNNNEKIAGTATVSPAYGQCPSIAMADNATGKITIDCGEGVSLGASSDSPTEFWFCIPPTEFTEGFTVTVTNTDGEIMERSTSASCTIVRNVMNDMPALEAEFVKNPHIPEMVDLGLSIKWASFNVGAMKPEESGDYFAWGETEPKVEYTQATLKYASLYGPASGHGTFTKYNTNSDYGEVDNLTVLQPADDAASANLGEKWHTPTKAQWQELVNNCEISATVVEGVQGTLFTSLKNGASIFIPGAGTKIGTEVTGIGSTDYWTSTLDSDYPDGAFRYYPLAAYTFFTNGSRYCGRPVRAVWSDSQTSIEEGPVYITARIENANGDTKASISDNQAIWGQTDSITVVDGTGAAHICHLISGDGTVTAMFESKEYFNISEGQSCYGVFDLQPDDKGACHWKMSQKNGAAGEIYNPMTASCIINNTMIFNYVGAILKLNVKGIGTVSKIEISFESCYIDNIETPDGKAIGFDSSGSTKVTLDCGEGIELDENSSQLFYITLPGGSYSNLSVNFIGKSGQSSVKSTSLLRLYAGKISLVSLSKIDLSEPSGFVDLGLSVKWATCNIGAKKPEECGRYFGWGDYAGQTWSGKYWSQGGFNKTYVYGYLANENLDSMDDAAHIILGDNWRMPSNGEFQELLDNSISVWVNNYNGTGVSGRLFTSKVSGFTDKSIFLPAAGYGYVIYCYNAGSYGWYWSRTFSGYNGSDNCAKLLEFASDHVCTYSNSCIAGLPIRPVLPKASK